MVCTADDLLGWRDFPRGLKVLLLDEDINSSAEIKLKLEEMGYIVSTFYNENEALSAISNEPESFHIAIVEVSTGASHGSFTFLENAKDLPTIMISNVHCLSTMMKCIALGAAEFLQKPLSEDKLRNIWQHVVHKAFNAGGSVISKSLNPDKETVACILELQSRTRKSENEKMFETVNEAKGYSCDHEQSVVSDRFPEPSTPQLKQGERLLDDGEFQDQPNSSIEKESGELEGESKSVEITCNDSVAEVTLKVDPSSRPGEALIKEEDDSIDGSKTGSNASRHLQNKPKVVDSSLDAGNLKKASSHPKPYGTKANRKKMKVDWTPELHKRFVKAVEQLGVDQAIPSRILELMKVEGLTRHNVASHLQKYRMHRRHILPKEEDRRWQHQRNPMQRNYSNKPLMPFPPYHSNHGLPTSQMYPVWGHPSSQPSGMQMWGHPGFPTWQPPESWYWNTYQGMQADAWGCPVMPPPQGPFSTFPQHAFHSFDTTEDRSSLLMSSFDLHPADEVLDKVVKEAISQPWLPLPLGLKPPSIESVLDELHRQGVSDIIINSSSC